MRVLCVCKSGNVRSVTLGRQLKKRGAEVLCCGVDKAFKSDTVMMLFRWADVVYCQKDAEPRLVEMLRNAKIPGTDFLLEDGFSQTIGKIDTRFDVGPDDWKIPDHPDLHRRVRDMIMADDEWGVRDSDNA